MMLSAGLLPLLFTFIGFNLIEAKHLLVETEGNSEANQQRPKKRSTRCWVSFWKKARQNYKKSEENQENFCSDDAEAVRNAIAAAVAICYNYFQKNHLHIVDAAERYTIDVALVIF